MNIFHKIPIDKQAHFYAGFGIAMAIGIYSPLAGFCLSVIAGAAKEAYDKYSGTGTPDGADFAATVIGGVLGYGWIIINQFLILSY